jgi:hypothetical protein
MKNMGLVQVTFSVQFQLNCVDLWITILFSGSWAPDVIRAATTFLLSAFFLSPPNALGRLPRAIQDFKQNLGDSTKNLYDIYYSTTVIVTWIRGYINDQCEKMRRARKNWSDVVLLALLRVVLPVAVMRLL